jgi:hypothetical protein
MIKKVVDAINLNDVREYSKNIDKEIDIAIKEIVSQAKNYKNNSLASQTGFVAESVHIGSFNINSAFKRSSLKAVKEKNGCHGDYKILKGNKVVAKGEFKHYNTAEQTENAMRGYDNRDLIGPKDQISDIKKIAKRKFLKNKTTRPKVAKEHKIVEKKVKNSIKKDNVSSKAKTLKEQRKITKKAAKGKVEAKDILPDFKDSLIGSAKSAALEGAKLGAGVGGAISVISNTIEVINGKKEIKKAVVDTTKETTISAVDSAVKNAAGSAAKTSAIYLAEKTTNEVTKTILKSSAPAVLAFSMVDIGKEAYKFANDEIDGEEFAKNSAKSIVTGAGAWAGAEAGAMIGGTVGGPVGAVVGGVIGGIAASLGIGSLFD